MSQQQMISQSYFNEIADALIASIAKDETLSLNLHGENTHYCRFNNATIRQNGTVTDFDLGFSLILSAENGEKRNASSSVNLSGDKQTDLESTKNLLAALQAEVKELPVDPFAITPTSDSKSESVSKGNLLAPKAVPDAILSDAKGLDLTGIYSSGQLIRANACSTGARHWYSADSFLLDYSLYGANESAYKGSYGGKDWDQAAYSAELEKGRSQLEALAKPMRKIEPGAYRTYLAPAAVMEFSGMLHHCFSEASLQQGDSPLRQVRQGEEEFSSLFSFIDDFSQGFAPRFTSEGDLYPETMNLIDQGKLQNTLISKRTAKEYNLQSNGAGPSESVQAPVVGLGSLDEKDALEKLGTGLYISNLHYLNWSDQNKGRITGMTRYACFWVEDGKLVAPIENLRWDDTIFRVLGSELEAVTNKAAVFPDPSSYGKRAVGAVSAPGMMLKSMSFTL